MTSDKPFHGVSQRTAESVEEVEVSALLNRARKAYAENRPSEAVWPLRCLLTVDPRHVDAQVILAGALARTNAVGIANVLFRRVNKLEVAESRHWRMHASVLIRAWQLNAAHRVSRKILVKTPVEAAGFQNLARIANLLGHNDEARGLLSRLNVLLPNDPNIATGLARSAMMTGALEEAETLCRRAADLSKGNAERLFDLGRVLRAREKFVEADSFLDRATDLDPSFKISVRVVRETAIDADFRFNGEPTDDA